MVVVLLLIFSSTNAWQSDDSKGKSNDWDLCTICGIPARIALNSSPGRTIVPRRDIYLLVEAADFSVENLTKAFEKLSAAYPDPVFLRIVAFSNEKFLKQLIKAEEGDSIIDFADTHEGREAANHYYSGLYPPRKGYFRSYYVRPSINQESFQYTPDPMDEKTVQVILKRRR